jgi:hypothetical protein
MVLCAGVSLSPHLFKKVGAVSGFPVHNINTGLNYATIQSAINAIQTVDGNSIKVDAGTYNETLYVDKSISVLGDNPANTIISMVYNPYRPYDHVVEVSASNVKIANFSIIGLMYIGADYCTISQNIISSGGLLIDSRNDTIQGNTIRDIIRDSGGINVPNGRQNCTIIENDIYNNREGVNLMSSIGFGCDHFIIIQNLIHNNSIALDVSGTDHIISENSIYNNSNALLLYDSSNDTIYRNNFFNNSNQVSQSRGSNYWDNGIEGNYWDDYNGTDRGNGIGSTPYVIDSYNQDNFPLMHMYNIPEFQSFLILPLFMIATILAVIVYKKKHT